MKIRIKGHTVRFRLTRSEVAQLAKTGRFSETTRFPGNVFTYAIETTDTGTQLSADFSGQTVTLYLPAPLAKEWTGTNMVGLDAYMDTGEEQKLYLLLEKDFKCLDETTEDQSDNYDNPLLG